MSEETAAASAPVDTNLPTSAPADNAYSVTGTIQSSADGDARIASAIAAANKAKAAAPKPEAAPKVEAVAEIDAPAIEGEESAPAAEADAKPKPEDSVGYRQRIRVREQQFRREAEQDRQAAAQERQQVEQQRQQVEQQRAYYARLENLRVNDPVAWLNETKMDLEPVVRSKIEENKPEARATAAERKAQQAIEKLEAFERTQQQREQQANTREVEQRFVSFALNEERYPATAAIYAEDSAALLRAGYDVVNQFKAQHGRHPSNEEIAHNIERIENAKYDRLQAKRGAKPVPAVDAKPAKKGSPITPGKTTEAASGAPNRALTAEERVQRAIQAAQESMGALAKT